MADAGDALEDANFEEQTANGAILRLTKELAWVEETMAATGMREGPPSTFLDRVFDNDINTAVHATKQAYDKLLFRCGIVTLIGAFETMKTHVRVDNVVRADNVHATGRRSRLPGMICRSLGTPTATLLARRA